ncbi:DUF6456 domain-containing protein [Aurantimonas endophytica]|uniref:DUF6456 domain-containing protein n=1 Tax=Aurantimonas endophytica TaxID=1522175 RepID=A0A7W6MN53_9HYPH|nr:DUF6456 domain-containing protein [Aurantimonas endophytica]MBB4001575.1 hypothetical protein [Aurantimonas endophytica]MCO6402785.1 hypothetical protein [Aurantimonas endophytica]
MMKRAARSPRLDVEMAEVDNPYWTPAHAKDRTNPRKVHALRNANESPLVLMESRGTITPLQAAAGLRFRMLYERVMAGPPSPGDIRERVDGGGGRADAMSESRMQAGRELALAAREIGRAEYWLVRSVCGEGQSLREIAMRTKVRRPSAAVALRHALDRLAEVWNLASKGTVAAHRRAA